MVRRKLFRRCERTKKTLLDFGIIAILAALAVYIPSVPAILAFIYLAIRIVFNERYYCFCAPLLLCSNTNVFFISGIPLTILVILLSVIVLIARSGLQRSTPILLVFLISLSEICHIVFYDYSDVIKCIGWIAALLLPVLVINDIQPEENHNSNNYDTYRNYYIFGVIISALYGCVFRVKMDLGFSVASFTTYDIARFGGGFGDPNYFSMACLIVLGLITDSIINKNYKKKYVLALYSLVSVILIYFCLCSLSRMFMICLALYVAYVLVYVLLNINKSSHFIKYVTGLVLLVLVFVSITHYDIGALIDKTVNRFDVSASNEIDISGGRIELIYSGLDYLSNQPITLFFGAGIQSYGSRTGVGHLHNFLLEIIFSLGIIGSIVYLLYFYHLSKSMSICRKVTNKFITYLPTFIAFISLVSLNAIDVEIFYPLFALLIMNFHTRVTEGEDN